MRRADRIEIVRRGVARGWSQNDIERITGVQKVDRYIESSSEAS